MSTARYLPSAPGLSYGTRLLLAAAALLSFGVPPVHADDLDQGAFQRWAANALGIENCITVLDGAEDVASTAADCVRRQVIAGALNAAFVALDDHGEVLFGEHFNLAHRLDYSASGGTISAELDAVIPLNAYTAMEGARVTRAVFFQNGVSSWTDQHGFRRNDVRLGMVHRFAVSQHVDAGVVGTSIFFQENVERGHARIVPGLDYTDWWGSGSLRYFMPTTDWRAGRIGHEERALEGMEFELSAAVTDALTLATAAGRWEDKDGAGDWITQGRVGVQWQPHGWLGLQAAWEGIGTADPALGLHAAVTIPFGGRHTPREQWRGLGRRNLDAGPTDPGALWNPVDDIGPIVVAEKQESQEEEEEEDLLNAVPQPSLNHLNTE